MIKSIILRPCDNLQYPAQILRIGDMFRSTNQLITSIQEIEKYGGNGPIHFYQIISSTKVLTEVSILSIEEITYA
jgi:hypothetical protein